MKIHRWKIFHTDPSLRPDLYAEREWGIKMKKCCTMLMLVIIGLSGFGCGTKEKGEVTEITLLHGWGTMEEDHQVMRQIYQDFEKENPDIRLNMVSMPSFEKAVAKAQDMLAVGKVPDLVFTGGKGKDDLYAFMVDHGYALDLMPYIREDPELLESISPVIWERWVNENGELYTVSDVLLLSGYWYNKTIFENAGIEKVPEDWDDFFECCEKICRWANEERISTVSLHLDPETCLYLTAAGMAAGDESDQELARALSRLERLKTVSSVEDQDYTHRDKVRSFNIGHSAICVNGVWGQQLLHPNLNVGYALFPTEDGAGVGMVSACTGYLVGDSADEKKKQACIRFLKYMLSEPVQKRILRETGQVPSNPQIDLEEVYAERPDLYEAYQVVMGAEKFTEIPASRWNSQWIEEYSRNIEDFLQGEITLENFLQDIEKKGK